MISQCSVRSLPRVSSRASCVRVRAAATKLVVTPQEVDSAVAILKRAAKDGSVAGREVFNALRKVEKGGASREAIESWPTLLGGTASPGRRWKLVYTADSKAWIAANKGGQGSGNYFPITAAQRWDSVKGEIENGIFFGWPAAMTFKGPYSMKGKILAFDFTSLNFKIGPLKFSIPLSKDSKIKEAFDKAHGPQRTKSTPFFVFIYADEDIVIAAGRSGGRALWARVKPSEEAPLGIVSL